MSLIKVCPGTLAPGFDTYSPSCLRKLFGGRKVSHMLDFSLGDNQEEITSSVNRLSISGVQEKLSAIVRNGRISLAREGESGRYIIKPAPDYRHLRFRKSIPANEHLTMQIAARVYKIRTAENALVFFSDGEPAYIAKRFDYAPDGSKILQDDFASLAGKTEKNHGKDFKYTGSYEDAATFLRSSLAASSYLPVYLKYSDVYVRTAHPCKDDFITFGKRIGVLPKKLMTTIDMFATEQPEVYELIGNSFLDDKTRRMYRKSYQERLHRFQRSDKL